MWNGKTFWIYQQYLTYGCPIGVKMPSHWGIHNAVFFFQKEAICRTIKKYDSDGGKHWYWLAFYNDGYISMWQHGHHWAFFPIYTATHLSQNSVSFSKTDFPVIGTKACKILIPQCYCNTFYLNTKIIALWRSTLFMTEVIYLVT